MVFFYNSCWLWYMYILFYVCFRNGVRIYKKICNVGLVMFKYYKNK